MSRTKRKKRNRQRASQGPSYGRRSPSALPKPSLRLALGLTVALSVLVVFTVSGILGSIRAHGHVHLNMHLLLADGVAGLFTILEWISWHKHH